MSTVSEGNEAHIECVDVNEKVKEIDAIGDTICDSGLETLDSCSATFPASDSEGSPVKNNLTERDKDVSTESLSNESSLSSPVSDDNAIEKELNTEHLPKDAEVANSGSTNVNTPENINENVENTPQFPQTDLDNINRTLTTSTMSLDEQNPIENSVMNKSPFSRSAENISNISFQQNNETANLNSSDKDLNTDKILSQFATHKAKISAVHKIPENLVNLDPKYTRIPKELLSQDIGSIVKNVHGIFSSVSGSLKSAYTHRTAYAQKPVKTVKHLPNGKLMNDIFEDENVEPKNIIEKAEEPIKNVENTPMPNIDMNIPKIDENSELGDAKNDVLKLQVESLERLLAEQRKENASLRERVKQQCDELQQKDLTFKDLENKLDLMSKRVEHAEREKDAAVMRYASVECAAIEARRAADNAAKAEKNAHAEVELLNGKLKSAHGEKQRICQLYDDKCHELMNCERELAKVREDLRELDGRLKWTQSKLRVEMDAYKESSERAEKLSQQVSELEAAKDAAAANAHDSVRAKQLEAKLKESQAALILCRHERDELERRLTSCVAQLGDVTRERDNATEALARATAEVEHLKLTNLHLEEEAAELAALRAKAALADTLSAQLQRESERASAAEEALSVERAVAETCGRREAAALEHAASLTAAHVANSAAAERFEAEARALSMDNVSLRERISTLEAECTRLQSALTDETDRRNKENRVLARKVAELTEEVAEANKKLEWEKGENGVLKKKHASAIKELNRELQRAMKRCEQLEAKLPPPDAPSTRTGSVSSLSSGESAPHEERLQNGHTDTLPDIQVREPDRQTLIERIVSLQRAAARRAERCEFLEEHSRQLTNELRTKARLLRHLLCEMPAGAVSDNHRDDNKKEIARLGGGAMAAVWGGDPAGLSAELALEMTRRLQAVLEDTLLKNITLKKEIARLGGGAMAAVWGGDPAGLSAELALEMTRRLQAVLEDTLLKNITLKKEIARLGGGAMAAVWGGDPAGLSAELALEMTRRLQAVLEDTLLKNITLKKEIARLGGGAMAAVWGGDPAGLSAELALEMTRRLQAVLEDTLLKNITLKKEIARLGGGAMAAVWGGDPAGLSAELALEMTRRLQAVLEDTLLKNITLKKEIARLGGGAMAAVWGGDPAGLSAELALEMTRRLQAVLEDTLLKNITLKENMDTLGAEISRLKEQLKAATENK